MTNQISRGFWKILASLLIITLFLNPLGFDRPLNIFFYQQAFAEGSCQIHHTTPSKHLLQHKAEKPSKLDKDAKRSQIKRWAKFLAKATAVFFGATVSAFAIAEHIYTEPTEAFTPLEWLSEDWTEDDIDLYRKYESGEMSAEDLKATLPYMMFIGDSNSKNFNISVNYLENVWHMRTENLNNMMIDLNDSEDSIESVFEKASKLGPIFAEEVGRPGAHIASLERIEDWQNQHLLERYNMPTLLVLQ